MSKIRIKRHDHYKNWALPTAHRESDYPAEAALFERLRTSPTPFFHTFQFAFTNADYYNYHLAFLVEAVELLPDKLDLSFDAVWRAFESFYGGQVIAPKEFKLNQEAPIIAQELSVAPEFQQPLSQFFINIPVQSCEYLVQRIMLHWGIEKIGNSKTDYKQIWNRLTNPPNNHASVTQLLQLIAAKYGAPSMTPNANRKAAMLLRLAINGHEVDVQGAKVLVPLDQRVSFLVNALLYTFRNDRFHGSMQPPFKSSVGTLQTYAHAHYCFLWAHFLFLFAVSKKMPGNATPLKVAENAIKNLSTFANFYGKHLLA